MFHSFTLEWGWIVISHMRKVFNIVSSALDRRFEGIENNHFIRFKFITRQFTVIQRTGPTWLEIQQTLGYTEVKDRRIGGKSMEGREDRKTDIQNTKERGRI